MKAEHHDQEVLDPPINGREASTTQEEDVAMAIEMTMQGGVEPRPQYVSGSVGMSRPGTDGAAAAQGGTLGDTRRTAQTSRDRGITMPNLDQLIKDPKCQVISAVLVLGAIVAAILLSMSFGTVDYDEWGLMYSTRSNKIDGDQVYEAGRYYTGLWKSFHRYPRWETNIDFTHAHASNVGGQKAFEIRATDGQIIGLELTIQYRLKKTGLLQIYKDYKFEYEINLIRHARGLIRDIGAKYSSLAYFDRRGDIEQAMKTELTNEFDQRNVDLTGFQMQKITLPTDLDEQLLVIQLEFQKSEKATADIGAIEIRSESEKQRLELQANNTNMIARIEQETENKRVKYAKEAAEVDEETRKQVKHLWAESNATLLKYNEETLNQVELFKANMTIEEERSRLAVRKVDLETAAYEAAKNANLTTIKAEAAAYCEEVEQGAFNSAKQMIEGAKSKHFIDLATKLKISVEDALHVLWVDAVTKNGQRLRMDMKTPSGLTFN
jgi:hypothetical protein